jgi:hypothetical protein
MCIAREEHTRQRYEGMENEITGRLCDASGYCGSQVTNRETRLEDY